MFNYIISNKAHSTKNENCNFTKSKDSEAAQTNRETVVSVSRFTSIYKLYTPYKLKIKQRIIHLPHSLHRNAAGPVFVVTAPHKAGIAADAPAFAKFRLTADG